MTTPKELRKAGEVLGREELAKMALNIMTEAVESGSYKKAIEASGMLYVIAQACDYDDYWQEKKDIGIGKATHALLSAAASNRA